MAHQRDNTDPLSRRGFVLGTVALVGTLVGCGGSRGGGSGRTESSSATTAAATPTTNDPAARFAQYEAAPEPNGDLSKVVWPDFVTQAPPEVKTLYEFQITHGELMRYMPCFCGCGQSAGHRSSRDCYVSEVTPDGSVVLDSMAPT